ncbi:MAG: Smr/MutS family protein [Pseudomonadota bacterium]|nr:MAG: Smr/MutS family protein [Pseudomonadota bacterium]
MADESDKHPDDDSLFRDAMTGVRPLRHDGAAPFHRRPPPEPAQTRRDQQQVLQDMLGNSLTPAEMETGDELLYARPGVQQALLRKLRRGQFSIEAELDLHGKTTPEAHQAVAGFLGDAIDAGKRMVRIVHGKGHGSFNKQPVLKGKVSHWLQRRDEVLAFCSARPVDGGTGAIYVLLRRQRT